MERERSARREARELREEKEYRRQQQKAHEQREAEQWEEEAARRRLFEEGENCAPDRFDELLKHPEELVRHGLAANPACTPELAERLADDDEEWVRVSALRKQAELLSDDTLDRLAEDRSNEVNNLAESTLLKRSEQKLQQEQCYSADTALQQMLVGAGAPQPGTAGFGLPQPALVGADNTPKCQKLGQSDRCPVPVGAKAPGVLPQPHLTRCLASKRLSDTERPHLEMSIRRPFGRPVRAVPVQDRHIVATHEFQGCAAVVAGGFEGAAGFEVSDEQSHGSVGGAFGEARRRRSRWRSRHTP